MLVLYMKLSELLCNKKNNQFIGFGICLNISICSLWREKSKRRRKERDERLKWFISVPVWEVCNFYAFLGISKCILFLPISFKGFSLTHMKTQSLAQAQQILSQIGLNDSEGYLVFANEMENVQVGFVYFVQNLPQIQQILQHMRILHKPYKPLIIIFTDRTSQTSRWHFKIQSHHYFVTCVSNISVCVASSWLI